MRKGAHMSPLGRLLMLVDYLGKVRMLVEQGVLEDGGCRAVCGAAGGCWGVLFALLASPNLKRRPAKAGIQVHGGSQNLDSRLRGNDGF
jgi:hypothetical protein